MSKDWFGEKLKEGDWVIYKGRGRYVSADIGIINKDGRVRVVGGTKEAKTGNCFKVFPSAKSHARLADKEFIALEKELEAEDKRKAELRSGKLKKSEQVRYGIFHSGNYDMEIRIGKCNVKISEEHTRPYENAWIKVYPLDASAEPSRDNLRLAHEFFQKDYHGNRVFTSWGIRGVKYPQKTTCVDVFTKEELEAWLGAEVFEHITLIGGDND